MRFGEYGGDINIQLNGNNQTFANFADIDSLTVAGVTISVLNGNGNDAGNLTLDGTITQSGIGGQELFVDDICPNTNTPMPAAVLHRYQIDQAAHPRAIYNNGSTPLFYFRRDVGGGADKWLFWFKGGGACCYDEASWLRRSSLKPHQCQALVDTPISSPPRWTTRRRDHGSRSGQETRFL